MTKPENPEFWWHSRRTNEIEAIHGYTATRPFKVDNAVDLILPLGRWTWRIPERRDNVEIVPYNPTTSAKFAANAHTKANLKMVLSISCPGWNLGRERQ
jgi:hypothetical protein